MSFIFMSFFFRPPTSFEPFIITGVLFGIICIVMPLAFFIRHKCCNRGNYRLDPPERPASVHISLRDFRMSLPFHDSPPTPEQGTAETSCSSPPTSSVGHEGAAEGVPPVPPNTPSEDAAAEAVEAATLLSRGRRERRHRKKAGCTFGSTAAVIEITPESAASIPLIEISAETVGRVTTPLKKGISHVALTPDDCSPELSTSTPQGACGGGPRKINRDDHCVVKLFDILGTSPVTGCTHSPTCIYEVDAEDHVEFERAFDSLAKSRSPTQADLTNTSAVTVNLDVSDTVLCTPQKPTITRQV